VEFCDSHNFNFSDRLSAFENVSVSIYAFHIYIGHASTASESFASLNARNSYLNTSGSRLILAFRNSGRRRIYSIAETHDTFEQWRRMLINRTDVIFTEMSS